MSNFNKISHGRHEGKLVLGDGIVDGIVYVAVSELPYVEFYSSDTFSKKNGCEDIFVTFNKEYVTVQVNVKIHYLQSVSDISFKIQEAIRHSVESMTEYKILSVNVLVKGVIFDDKEVKQPEETLEKQNKNLDNNSQEN